MKLNLLILFITLTIVNIVNCNEENVQHNEPLSFQETKQDNLQPTLDSHDGLLTRLVRTFYQKGGGGGGYCDPCARQQQAPIVQQPSGCSTCGGGGGGSFSGSSSSAQSSSFSGGYGKK